MRVVFVATLALAVAPSALASIVVTSNAQKPALRVDARGNVEVSWTSGGQRQTLLVPVRGPTRPGRRLAGRDISHPVRRPPIPFARVFRLGLGGWHYALQSPPQIPGAPVELHFARWRGTPTHASLVAAKATASDELSGTVSFGGKPIPAKWLTPEGKTVYPFVVFDSLVGGTWTRTGGVAPKADGSFRATVPYTNVGDRFRAIVMGPNIGATYAPDALAIAPSP